MNPPPLPPEIKVIRDSMTVTRYILPKRNLGDARKFGWLPIGFGLFITLFMIFWMSGPISGGLHGHGGIRWFELIFGLLGLPGLAAGLGLIALGIVILANASHSEIIVEEGFICAVERIGPIPIRRKRRIAELHRFVVRKGGITSRDQNTGAKKVFAPHLAALQAETIGKTLWLAPAYPYEMLRPLADVLAASLSLDRHPLATEDSEPVIEVVESEGGEETPATVVPKPESTDIICQANPHGLAIEVPPKGLWKGSQGFFGFSLFWNGFMVVFSVAMFKGHPPLPVYLFISLFWAVGIGMLLVAINMAKKKVLIAVVNDMLACRVIGPFKTREQKIALSDVDTIKVGPSGMEVNHRPLMELQIIPKQGKKIGLLSNRSGEEQEWLAYVLREAVKTKVTKRP